MFFSLFFHQLVRIRFGPFFPLVLLKLFYFKKKKQKKTLLMMSIKNSIAIFFFVYWLFTLLKIDLPIIFFLEHDKEELC